MFFFAILYSCEEKSNYTEKEQEFEKMHFYTKSFYDSRIEEFLNQFEESTNFALIDYATCARCSEDKIDVFFQDLSKNEKITILFNDSVVYYKFNHAYQKVDWKFIDSEYWKNKYLESSIIARYKRTHNNKFIRLE
jgi:hypothetical protein